MTLATVLGLLAVLVLVLANAFFVAAEFALVSARRTRVREMVSRGDRLARAVETAQDNLDRSISGTQLGITLASLGLGWIGEPALADLFEGLFAALPGVWSTVTTHAVAVAAAFALITFLHIVLGELAPKSLALIRPEAVSRVIAPPLNLFNWFVTPFIWILNGAANLTLRLVGIGAAGPHERVHSPEEIQMLIRQSLQGGEVEQDEEAMIEGVFHLARTMAREVMTPRTDIVAVPETATLSEVMATMGESGFSRLPVYGESVDDITGIVLVKDLLAWMQRSGGDNFDLRRVAREAYFVPDTKPVDDLLAELRQQKVHMAIVVDEFGGTDGIVSLEDVVEEIVGDIFDEHDVAESDVVVQDDGRILVDGGFGLADLVDRFDLQVGEEAGQYDTVAGYVIGQLGRIPDQGEAVALDNAELEVRETQDRRVTRVELRLPREEEEGGAARGEGTAGAAVPAEAESPERKAD